MESWVGLSGESGAVACLKSEKNTIPETNVAPENRQGPKRKRSYFNHPFSGAKMYVSGRVLFFGELS